MYSKFIIHYEPFLTIITYGNATSTPGLRSRVAFAIANEVCVGPASGAPTGSILPAAVGQVLCGGQRPWEIDGCSTRWCFSQGGKPWQLTAIVHHKSIRIRWFVDICWGKFSTPIMQGTTCSSVYGCIIEYVKTEDTRPWNELNSNYWFSIRCRMLYRWVSVNSTSAMRAVALPRWLHDGFWPLLEIMNTWLQLSFTTACLPFCSAIHGGHVWADSFLRTNSN